VYIEALATLSASSELELAETRGALRDARDEVETFSSTNQSLRRERDALNEEVLVLKTKLERAEALRETLERTHASEMSASTRRAEAAEAEARLLVREKKEKEKAARDATRGDVPVDTSSAKRALGRRCRVCVSRRRGRGFGGASYKVRASLRKNRKSLKSLRWTVTTTRGTRRRRKTARAYEALDAHRRSIQTHLEALQRDRETLASTKRTVRSESYL
jgi:hypothetical protein